jgi:outer membrane protein assembly factor BamB
MLWTRLVVLGGLHVMRGLTGRCALSLNEASRFVRRTCFKYSGCLQATPVVGLGKVFGGNDDDMVRAYDAKSGAKVWSVQKGVTTGTGILVDV